MNLSKDKIAAIREWIEQPKSVRGTVCNFLKIGYGYEPCHSICKRIFPKTKAPYRTDDGWRGSTLCPCYCYNHDYVYRKAKAVLREQEG